MMVPFLPLPLLPVDSELEDNVSSSPVLPGLCSNASRRALESQRTKGTAEEEIRLRANFRPAAGDMNLTK
jgi:hypothetical protein